MLLCDSVSVVMHLCCHVTHVHSYLFFSVLATLFNQFNVNKQLYWGSYILANKLVIMSIYTHNWESVMNLNNIRLNIDEKTIEKNKKRKKRKKQIKKRFFHKKPFFIEIKN